MVHLPRLLNLEVSGSEDGQLMLHECAVCLEVWTCLRDHRRSCSNGHSKWNVSACTHSQSRACQPSLPQNMTRCPALAANSQSHSQPTSNCHSPSSCSRRRRRRRRSSSSMDLFGGGDPLRSFSNGAFPMGHILGLLAEPSGRRRAHSPPNAHYCGPPAVWRHPGMPLPPARHVPGSRYEAAKHPPVRMPWLAEHHLPHSPPGLAAPVPGCCVQPGPHARAAATCSAQ